MQKKQKEKRGKREKEGRQYGKRRRKLSPGKER